MSDNKIININDRVSKHDLEVILQVNRKAIEIETEMTDQNEEIICGLARNREKQDKMDEKLDKSIKQHEMIDKKLEDMSKDIFKIQILFITGILGLIMQIVQIFLKK